MVLKILNMNFTSGMEDTGSSAFYSVASPYSTELDRLFLLSSLSDVYRGNKVTSLTPGSIQTSTELLFLDTGAVKDSNVVQNVISSADRASQWEQSDAREMGPFVVCGDCVTVDLEFTRVRQLPPRPVLPDTGVSTASPAASTALTGGVPSGTSGDTSTVTAPNVVLSTSTPFLTDGHFVIACDVTNAASWAVLTIELRPDTFPATTQPSITLVTLRKDAPTVAEVAGNERGRIRAFPRVTSSDTVGVVVNVTSVTCADRGDYWCRLKTKNGEEITHSGRVGILETYTCTQLQLPSVPVITEALSSTAWDATPVYSCSAKLGYPPGELTLNVADDNSANLRLISGHVTGSANDCEAETSVRVFALDSAALGNATRLVCQLFSDHLRLLDSTQYSVFHQIFLSSKLEIQTKSAAIDDGLAAIRCRLLNPSSSKWTRLTLQRMTSDVAGGSGEAVVSLANDGNVAWTDLRLRHRTLVTSDVRKNLAEISVFIYTLQCADEATYACVLEHLSLAVEAPRAYLNVTVKPTLPSLSVPVNITDKNSETFSVTCKAKVGRPAGSLVLTTKHQSEADFRELSFNEQTSIPLPCTTEVNGIFHASAGALTNGSAISCHVVPNETVRDTSAKTETVVVFKTLADDLCTGLQERNVTHPFGCRHFVQCKDDVIKNVISCPDGFCFNPGTATCSVPVAHPSQQDSMCPPGEEEETTSRPHPHQCDTFVQCSRGRANTRRCPAGKLYVTGTSCSSDVTQSHCYKTLDTGVGLVTSSVDIP